MSLTRRDERIDSAYVRWLQAGHIAPDPDLEDAFAAGWLAGGAQVLRDSAKLAELVPTLRDLIGWFEADA